MSKMPAFQFYPGDWRKDPNLSRVSLAAKGAMIEIMCLAFECEKRGILKTGKNPWSINEIAMAIGGDIEINRGAIQELLDKKVLKKDRKGAIFSHRMCKDEKIRKVRKEAGSKGGNPILLNQPVIQTTNQKPTPSSSSSSSSSINKQLVISELKSCGVDQNILESEAEKLMKHYSGKAIKNLTAICNKWAAYLIGATIMPMQEKRLVI